MESSNVNDYIEEAQIYDTYIHLVSIHSISLQIESVQSLVVK